MIFYLYPSSQTRQHWAPFYGFLCTWALPPTLSLFPFFTNLVWDGEERESTGLTSFPPLKKKSRGELTACDLFLIQPFNELYCQSFLSLFLTKPSSLLAVIIVQLIPSSLNLVLDFIPQISMRLSNVPFCSHY